MIRVGLFFVLLISVCACLPDPLQGLRGPVSIGVGRVVLEDCYAKLGRSSDRYENCQRLSECSETRVRGIDGFDTQNARLWAIIDQILPPDRTSENPLTISEMRSNAQQAGPRAVELFSVLYEVRNHCLMETGLRSRIDDS